jgi:CO/xanthine dehydrogenase FAD-binding subunit
MRYTRPADVDGVTAALADGDAVVVGGGTMVVPEMTHGRVRPSAVVDLAKAGLAGVARDGDGWVIGAMTTYTELARSNVPLLAIAARGITGGPQIRNRGTVGGSASYANPSSDVPAVLVALGARMRLARRGGAREVPAAEFFAGAFRTAREPDEVLTAITVPGTAAAAGYVKFKLVEGSWPIVTAAALAGPTIRVVLGGAAAAPVAVELERASWRARLRSEVDRLLTEPWDDVLAPGHYRARIAPVIAARAVAGALEEA